MRFGSVCSGIEAASVAWSPLGWSAAWFAEVDRAASDVLKYRFPHVVNHGDMTGLAAMVLAGEIEAPDILVGGTPCQAFSVAGRREGLADARGQLTLAFVDLVDAIDRVRRLAGKPPVIVVWENVPGVLTSKDNAFGCFLAGIAGEDDALVPAGAKWTNAGAVLAPERSIAWRTLDAQYFGLTQRRRRVFVVASAREDIDPAAILLESDGVRRDSAPRREAGEGITHPVAPCLTSSGRGVERTGDTRGQDAVVDDSDDGVRSQRPAGLSPAVPTWWDGRDVSQTLDAVLHKGQTMPEKNRFPAVLQPIASSAKDYGGDASVGDTPTLRSMNHDGSHANGGGQVGVAYAIQERAVCVNPAAGPDADAVRADDCAYTLEARSVPQGVAYSVALRGREGGATAELGDEVAGAQRASSGGGDKAHVLAPVAPAVCVTGSVTHTLKAEGFDASEDGTGRGQPIVPAIGFAQNQRDEVRLMDVSGALAAEPGMKQTTYVLGSPTTMAVRRLMPVECERLQGFPDNWTLVPTGKHGKPAADGPRYKQCGNSMATNVMHWIGRRIKATLPGDNGGPPLDDFADLIG